MQAHEFYEHHGGKAIILARFIPILRTFAPFVAGIGQMRYLPFIIYNVIGSVAWVLLCLLVGYSFGNVPFVQKNFTLIIYGVILFSLIPAVLAYLRQRKQEPVKQTEGQR
jgi:membrane-associated protein